MINITKLLENYSISYVTSGNKHCMPGWVQVHCPFCEGSRDFHLGYNTKKDYFNCWRCGYHSTAKALVNLLNLPSQRLVRDILILYGGRPIARTISEEKQYTPKQLLYPIGLTELKEPHKQYLRSRKFDPEKLERQYNLKGTGFTGDYRFRIIAPVWYKGFEVSYQGRDITNRQDPPYKACKQEDELRPHKHCLYGEFLEMRTSIVVVEGITDVWRLGPGSVGTFGVQYTPQQVQLLKKYKRRFMLFDSEKDDPNAIKQAKKLADSLSAFGGETHIIKLDQGDPAKMEQKDADHFMKEFGIRTR
jgi:hypothetical protein